MSSEERGRDMQGTKRKINVLTWLHFTSSQVKLYEMIIMYWIIL